MKNYSTEFNTLRDNGFIKTYNCVMDAMRYYDSDYRVCCSKYRIALESVVDDIYKLYGCSIDGYSNNKRDIDGLRDVIPEPFYNDKITYELHNLRNIGNTYAHLNDDRDCDAYKDRYTCFFAMKEISCWLVDCKKKYPAYKAKREAERKERKEKSKKFWKTVGKVLSGAAMIGFVILGGKKMHDGND